MLMNDALPEVVIQELTQEEQARSQEMCMDIIKGVKAACVEHAVDAHKYPEVFGKRTIENTFAHHFCMTVRQLIKTLIGAYEAGRCPKVLMLADKHFQDRFGETAIKEFKQDCFPITCHWQPLVLRGDPTFRGDVNAKKLVDDIARVSFLSALNLPLLWNGSEKENWPALQLGMKTFVLKTLKRLDFLCCFYRYSTMGIDCAPWYLHTFTNSVLGSDESLDSIGEAVKEKGIDIDEKKMQSTADVSDVFVKVAPVILGYLSGDTKGQSLLKSITSKLTAKAFGNDLWVLMNREAKRNSTSQEILTDTYKKIMRSVGHQFMQDDQ